MGKDKKHRRTFLEVLVDQGHSTEEIMKWKDSWDWTEKTEEDFQEGIKLLEDARNKKLEREN